MAYVMIIDDDEDFATATGTALRTAGHEVGIAFDPDSALASMDIRPPNLIVLDVMFPEDASAGFSLARTLRCRTNALRDVPILLLTAVNSRFPLGFSTQDISDDWLPVSDFLEKPVNLRLLAQRVEALLHKAGPPASQPSR